MRHPRRYVFLLLGLLACSSPGSAPSIAGTSTPHMQPASDAALAPGLAELPPDPREPLLARGIGHMLSEEHLRHRPIDDSVSNLAFDEYLKRLDGGKLFLLQSHVEALDDYADRIDDQLREGNLVLARKGAALLAERRKVVAKLVAELLAKPFDFTKNEEVETDAKKLSFAKTEQELADRWRKMLKLQVLERVAQMEKTEKGLSSAAKGSPDKSAQLKKPLENIPPTLEGKEKKAREEVASSYAGRFTRLETMDPLEPAERLLNAVTAVYDPHSVYLAPEDKENFDIEMSGSLEGIGAVLAEDDHYIEVREVVPGGASWRQGKLEAGDLILSVAQEAEQPVDVIDMPIDKVVRMIRGPKGTAVTLTVKKPDDRIEVIDITRDVIEIEAAYARGAVLDLGPNDDAYGYIYLPSFYGNTRKERGNTGERNATDDVKELLEIFQKKRLDGVIIDLRGNGGGLLGHARDITGLLIPTGPVVQARYSNGKLDVLSDPDPGVAFTGKVVVLVDRFSASASEILAGALQDYHRALVIGTGPTHGKGTVQVLVDLDRLQNGPGGDPLGVLKLTIQQYFRVAGDSTQWRGVVPDITLPDPAAHVESGERFLDHSIPWSEVEPLPYKPWSNPGWDVKTLQAKSLERRGAIPVFAKIDQRSALLKKRRDQTRVPLDLNAWKTKRERDEKELEAVDPKLTDGKPRFEVVLVGPEANKPPPRRDNGETGKSAIGEWKDELARDPWVEEALHVLADMPAAR